MIPPLTTFFPLSSLLLLPSSSFPRFSSSSSHSLCAPLFLFPSANKLCMPSPTHGVLHCCTICSKLLLSLSLSPSPLLFLPLFPISLLASQSFLLMPLFFSFSQTCTRARTHTHARALTQPSLHLSPNQPIHCPRLHRQDRLFFPRVPCSSTPPRRLRSSTLPATIATRPSPLATASPQQQLLSAAGRLEEPCTATTR